MKRIKISGKNPNDLHVLVDDEDYSELSKHSWYLNKGYAIRVALRKDGSRVTKMHRQIMSLNDPTLCIDHIDHDRLNNQKHNLRIVTQHENTLNQISLYRNNTSGMKGVSWHVSRKKWQAYIIRNGKNIYLGLYGNKEDATNARRQAERQMVEIDPPVQDQDQIGRTGDVQTELHAVEAPSGT